MKYLFTIIIDYAIFCTVNAQLNPILNLVPAHSDKPCYEIQLHNIGTKSVYLAGQNYRLYYDAQKSSLEEESIKSFLPCSFTDLKLVQHKHNLNASGFSALPYKSHLGLINLATDYISISTDEAFMIKSNSIYKISKLCINHKSGRLPRFMWGQVNLTHSYATEFVKIALKEGKRLHKANLTNCIISKNEQNSIQNATVVNLGNSPNPFSNKLNITFNHTIDGDIKLKVFDSFGNLILTQNILHGSSSTMVEDTRIPSG